MGIHRRSPREMDKPGSTPRLEVRVPIKGEGFAPRDAVDEGVTALVCAGVKITVLPFHKIDVRQGIVLLLSSDVAPSFSTR